MPSGDPAHDLQSAARKFGKHVAPHRPAATVTISDGFGNIASLPIVEVEVTKAELVARGGWDFSEAVPRFDGTIVPVHGRKAEILRLLAESKTPLLAKTIRDALDPHMSEGTARWHVGDLRDALAALFPGLADPIETTGEGYVLHLR